MSSPHSVRPAPRQQLMAGRPGCSPVPPREKKPLNRTGKRIKLSQYDRFRGPPASTVAADALRARRAIFGDATGAVPPDLGDAKTESAIPIGSVSAFASAREVLGAEYSQALSVGSAAGRLATSEVQGSLISSLLDCERLSLDVR